MAGLKHFMNILDYKDIQPQINNGTFKFYNFYNLDLDDRIFYGVQYYKNTKENVEEVEQILKIVFVDIEAYRVEKDIEFDFDRADHPISAISFNFNDNYYSYFLKLNDFEIDIPNWESEFKQQLIAEKYITNSENISIKVFTNELDLITAFWNKLKEIDPVILSGWNSHKFDFPYIYRRLLNLNYGDESAVANIISPLKSVKLNNKAELEIIDYTICDLMHMYMPREDGGRNYGRKQLSYSLDYISDVELGLKKFEYKSKNIDLDDFYDNDPKGYLFYNLIDVILCVKLNAKLRHIELNNSIRRSMKCPFEKSLVGASAIFDSFVIQQLDKKIRFGMITEHKKSLFENFLSSLPSFPVNKKTNELLLPINITGEDYHGEITKYDGAYVTQPKPDIKNKGIVFSLDATSMYPSMMIQYNISFDTYKARILPGRTYNFLKVLNDNLGKHKTVPIQIANALFSVISNYIASKENLQNKAQTQKILYFSAIYLITKLFEQGLPLAKILKPTNDKEQYLLSFYLLHLLEILNLVHPLNFSYNDVIYSYLFDEDNFTKNYPEIYVIDKVATPREYIVKLTSNQAIDFMKNYIVTITGDCFAKHDQHIGLFTNMLEDFSKKRKFFQSKMEQYPEGSPEYQLYDNRQNATKIVMNSNYGVQGLKSFRFSNSHLAQCITTQGKLTIKLAQYISDIYIDSKQ